jgi:hypothetical protein
MGEGMKRKYPSRFCYEIDSLSLSLSLFPKKEQVMEIAKVQAIKNKQARERERERERAVFLFHHLLSYSALPPSCLPLATHSLSLFPPSLPSFNTREWRYCREKESKREEGFLTDQRFHLLLFHKQVS